MNPEAITGSLMEYLADEIECRMLDDRLVCDTALYYPNGDSVVVLVTDHDGRFEVSDQSEGTAVAIEQLHRRPKVLTTVGQRVCAQLGLTFSDGRVSSTVGLAALPDTIWRVAGASLQIAEAVGYELARPERTRKDFAVEVEHELTARRIDVERSRRIIGKSGHEHNATLYVPAAHMVVEPVAAESAWTRATAVYAEFGDLQHANGYARVAVIDDRYGGGREDMQNLLQQVATALVYWSNRSPWVQRIAGTQEVDEAG